LNFGLPLEIKKEEKHYCHPFPFYSFGRTDLCIAAVSNNTIGFYLPDLPVALVADYVIYFRVVAV